MALINCPECGRERVSDTAIACPDCGFGIREYFERVKQEEYSEQPKEDEKPQKPESEVLKRVEEEQLRIQREIEKEEARIKEIKEIDEFNKKRAEELEQKKTNDAIKIQKLVKREVKVDVQNLYADDLLIPISLIKRITITGGIVNASIYVIGDNNKLIKMFKVLDSSRNNQFFAALGNNIRANGGIVEVVKDGKRMCSSCYHVIDSSLVNCPHCNSATGAALDPLENGYKCPNCGRNAGHPIKKGGKALSIGFWGAASNTVGKTYQCRKCNYMW